MCWPASLDQYVIPTQNQVPKLGKSENRASFGDKKGRPRLLFTQSGPGIAIDPAFYLPVIPYFRQKIF